MRQLQVRFRQRLAPARGADGGNTVAVIWAVGRAKRWPPATTPAGMVQQDGEEGVAAWRRKKMQIEDRGAYICESWRPTPNFFSSKAVWGWVRDGSDH
jgi:hypothetical protein